MNLSPILLRVVLACLSKPVLPCMAFVSDKRPPCITHLSGHHPAVKMAAQGEAEQFPAADTRWCGRAHMSFAVYYPGASLTASCCTFQEQGQQQQQNDRHRRHSAATTRCTLPRSASTGATQRPQPRPPVPAVGGGGVKQEVAVQDGGCQHQQSDASHHRQAGDLRGAARRRDPSDELNRGRWTSEMMRDQNASR